MSDDLHHTLGRIEGSLEALKETVERYMQSGTRRLDKHDERISAMEKKVWQAAGVAGLIAILIPLIPAAVRNLFHG